MAARQPQLVVARVNPRSLHKTIGEQAGEAHGFKVRRAARKKPDGASEGASSLSNDKGRGAFGLTSSPWGPAAQPSRRKSLQHRRKKGKAAFPNYPTFFKVVKGLSTESAQTTIWVLQKV